MKGLGLVLSTGVISGVSIFLNKFGVSGVDPALFTMAKGLIVAAMLVVTLGVMREWQTIQALPARTWRRLALIGLVGGSIPFLLFFTGLRMTSAAQGSLIHKTLFVWVAILAYATLRERIAPRMMLGGALLLTGNAVLLGLTGFTPSWGDLLIICATLLWAIEITLSRATLLRNGVPGRIVALGRMGFGSLYLLLFVLATGKGGLIPALDGASLLWIIFTGALLYGYVFTFYEGLARVPAATATAVLMIGSAITTLLNLVWEGTLAWMPILGSVLILAGALSFVGIHTLLPSPRQAGQ